MIEVMEMFVQNAEGMMQSMKQTVTVALEASTRKRYRVQQAYMGAQ